MENKTKITSFTDLKAWQMAHELALLVYKITKDFPKEEQFGLTNQLRRAVVSITSCIAEGFSRRTMKEKIRFYFMALGSLTEVQNQLLLSKDLKYVSQDDFDRLAQKSVVISKLLNGLIKSSESKLSS